MTEVKAAAPDDLPAIVELLEEMDRFYGIADVDPLDLRLHQAHEALFGAVPAAQALLAWDGDQLVGLAAYAFLWPAVGLTRSLYLKELYVTQTARRQGVARLLMRHLCEVAIAHGCSRLEWTTDQDNPLAQGFYDALGAKVSQEKLFYRLEGADQIRLMALAG